MVNLLYTELLKLKRAKMFMISVIGSMAAPIMMFIAFLSMKREKPETILTFDVSFYNTNLNVLMLIGTLLYGVIAAYLFSREYTEDTLKNLLTIPVSKTSLIVSKWLLLLLWIFMLTLVAWVMTLLLSFVAQFEGLSVAVIVDSLRQFFVGAFLLFLLSTPIILITMLFKNFVPTIIFTAVVTMANLTVIDTDYQGLFPWSAVHMVVTNSTEFVYPISYSYAIIFATSILGLAATIVYFKRSDID
ncbi:ABC transporter permease [Paenibacillus sp. SC116]|uniref:ABC transporter permease n=1 Tax=Paenibacillus sp. SC116 TaxID=2968986 RepID=UPI00215A28CF|nr:ABC transporter permease [Paenibacillus sp. SC116]MCR8845175.1 ABC transporter permease [Paenibacillus sp. SC116]